LNPGGIWEYLGSSVNPFFILDSENNSQAFFRVCAVDNP